MPPGIEEFLFFSESIQVYFYRGVFMKVIIRIPWYFRLLNAIGCLLMLFGILEMYFRFLPEDAWRYTPIVCIVVGVFLIIPQHFLSLLEILKYRPRND